MSKPMILKLNAARCLFAVLLLGLFSAGAQDPILTGVVDGDLSGGTPKGVEIYFPVAVEDLSVFGIGSANNGGGSGGVEFSFPNGSVAAGTYLLVGGNDSGWMDVFGRDADFVTGALLINGNDAVELFKDGEVIDTFGQVDADGAGSEWDYRDSYAYRANRTGPDGLTFQPNNWVFGGSGVLDGKTAAEQAAEVGRFFGNFVLEGEDPFRLSASFDPAEVAEDAGTEATTLTISIDRVAAEDLSLSIREEAGDVSEALFSASVVLPAGDLQVSLPVTPIDDGMLDGNQTIRVAIEAEGVVGTTAELVVTDIAEGPDVVINELFIDTGDGDPNGDGVSSFDDEFIEVVNNTGSEIDLGGWSLWTFGNRGTSTERHVFPQPTLLADGAAIVVFQGIDVSSIGPVDFGGVTVQAASSGLLFLQDLEDIVSLKDDQGRPVDVLRYSVEDVAGVSLNRDPDVTGPRLVTHPVRRGQTYSPGVRIDGRPFSGVESVLGLGVESNTLVEPNDQGEQLSTIGTVRRLSEAGLDEPLVVQLMSSDETEAVPSESSVTIPAGAVDAQFTIESVEDGEQDGDVEVVITAAAPGFVGSSVTLTVLDAQLDFARLESETTMLSEDGEEIELALRLFSLTSGLPKAVDSELVVQLSVDEEGELEFPSTVVVSPGQSEVRFPVKGVPDGDPEVIDPMVTLSAEAPG
ncbi:MAG: lamin tail domain-containing protein, partial [Verrucomicrobiota bacterium]